MNRMIVNENMERIVIFILSFTVLVVMCKPLDKEITDTSPSGSRKHTLTKRFINSLFALGNPEGYEMTKVRIKRSEDQCEKLALCKLHARSAYNFFAAYELYFVNKENARLWDHGEHSLAECKQLYGDCYGK